MYETCNFACNRCHITQNRKQRQLTPNCFLAGVLHEADAFAWKCEIDETDVEIIQMQRANQIAPTRCTAAEDFRPLIQQHELDFGPEQKHNSVDEEGQVAFLFERTTGNDSPVRAD